MYKIIFPIFIALLILVSSCQDEIKFSDDGNATLSFTTDTIHFDTVFTSIGSTTKQLRIHNPNDNAIKTTVKLASGNNSYFRLNIDGLPTNELRDLEIMGKDSAFVFVEVNVDPQGENDPMIITDSILFMTNGNLQDVKLVAHGQDVHLLNDSVIGTTTWVNDKPYLIYNSIQVDTLETLTIEPGVRIYFHKNASLFVKGSLRVQGTKDEMVTFQGDRLDEYYKDIPGSWGAILRDTNENYFPAGNIHFLKASFNNTINYAEIKNGNIGIQVDYIDPTSENPTLILSNSIIHSMSLIGLEARTTNLVAYNTVIANCGYYCARLMYGGNYEFYHSTIANYYPSNYGGRSGEALAIKNYYIDNNVAYTFPFAAHFGNCIITGNSSKENELIVDQAKDTPFFFEFNHCMLKLNNDFDTGDENVFKNVITHKDSLPRFIDTEKINFRLDTLSAAKDKGSTYYSNFIPTDLDGNSRIDDDAPDLGAYERIENAQ